MEGRPSPAGLGLRVPSKAGREDTRATNLRLVLQLLLGGEPLSRADLARATELTPATVSALIAELERADLVMKAGIRRDIAQIGKPPTMLQLRAEARNVIALDLSDPDVLRAAVVDLSGEIEARVEIATGSASGDAVEELVTELALRTIEKAPAPILGIGIGTPGVVSKGGVIIEAVRFGWHHVHLRERLESVTGHPTHIRNDANVAAIAEFTRGKHDCTNLAVVKIGSGVGAGFVLNGQPFDGEHGGAGEIGHLVVDADGPLCRCGHRGCLETFVSSPSIQTAFEATGADPEAVRENAGRQLGTALAAIVAILDIDHILVAGPRDLLGDDFCQIATASLRTRCLDGVAESVCVQFTALGGDIVLLGAAGLVLSQELGVA